MASHIPNLEREISASDPPANPRMLVGPQNSSEDGKKPNDPSFYKQLNLDCMMAFLVYSHTFTFHNILLIVHI